MKNYQCGRTHSEQEPEKRNQIKDLLLSLHETTVDVVGHEYNDDLIQLILSRAAGLANVESGYIALLDSTSNSLQIKAVLGFAPDESVYVKVRSGEGLAGQALRKNCTLQIEDYANWPQRISDPALDKVTCALAIPMLFEGKVQGVFVLLGKRNNQRFSAEQVLVLEQLARMASIVLTNAGIATDLRQRELKIRAFLLATPDLILRFDRRGRLREFSIPQNSSFFEISALQRGIALEEIFTAKNAELALLTFEKAFSTGTMQTFEYEISSEQFGTGYREVRVMPLDAEEAMSIVRDTTERKSAEKNLLRTHELLQAQHEELLAGNEELTVLYEKLAVANETLRESEERYRLALAGSKDAIFDWDIRKNITRWSGQWSEVLGLPQNDAGEYMQFWENRIHPDDKQIRDSALEAHLAGKTPFYSAEFRVLDKNGEYIWILSRGKALFDENGNAIRIAGSYTDITEQRWREQEIQHMAFHDSLTGLPNRSMLTEQLNGELLKARTGESAGAILFLDIDNFKMVNDSFGHENGDDLLRRVSRRFQEVVGEKHIVARLGGDEFIVLLVGVTDMERIGEYAQNLLNIFSEPIDVCCQKVFLAVSIGISRYPADGLDEGNLLRDADIALHEVKQGGKNGWKFFDQSMQNKVLNKMEMEQDLRNAVHNQEFFAVYQPIVETVSKRVVGYEVLARWKSPKRGDVLPNEFIPVAEENGLIIPIGNWVMHKACEFGQRLRAQGKPGSVSVNISARQLAREDFVATVSHILAQTGLPPGDLELEITESVLIESFAMNIEKLLKLRKIGVKVSLDDFGTGYSSLTYLKALPISRLKIDKSFIEDIDRNKTDAAILGTIIQLAHEIGLDVVGEGVETEAQYRILCRHNCDIIQGYLISRPISEEIILGQ